TGKSLEESALGVIQIANHHMAEAVRLVTIRKGHDPKDFKLFSFGGASPLHAGEIAKSLNIPTVVIPKISSEMSAFGFLTANIRHDFAVTWLTDLKDEFIHTIEAVMKDLNSRGNQLLIDENVPEDKRLFLYTTDLRFKGQAFEISVDITPIDIYEGKIDVIIEKFQKEYERQYGYADTSEPIEIVNYRMAAIGLSSEINIEKLDKGSKEPSENTLKEYRKVYLNSSKNYEDIPVYDIKEFLYGNEITGPAIVDGLNTTILLEKDESGKINVVINKKIDTGMMELVSHTLVSIAEEMSVTLQRTAYSSIVREAMDYSTAIFNTDGDLVAQSDNIPTHLGSMGKTLKGILNDYYQIEDIYEDDMIIINHPYMGASHTPDILLFAPIFSENELVAFSGTMCHHVDVGGSVAGSAPTNATEIFQEGLLLPPMKLYEKGKENDSITKIIRANVRMPNYTLGDLRSQISSNKVGVRRLKSLYEKYGNSNVNQIMKEWISYSENKIRKKISKLPDGKYFAEGNLDDDGVDIGEKIPLRVEIEIQGDEIIFDFSDSSEQSKGPFNVTQETVWSVAYYITRSITEPDIPQNEGVFKPVNIKLKEGTILNPRFPAPVSGRYHTIMRLSDICFHACAKFLPG